MTLWIIEFDSLEMLKTLIIAFLVILLSLILFYFIWLKNPYFEVPTEYYKVEYQFDTHANFFTKMRVLIFDILNHSYWIKHIGYDGKITRLLLSSFHAKNLDYFDNIFNFLYDFFFDLFCDFEYCKFGFYGK